MNRKRKEEESGEQIVRRKERKERKREINFLYLVNTRCLETLYDPLFHILFPVFHFFFRFPSFSFFFLSLFLPFFFLSFCFQFLFDPGRVGRGLRIEIIEYVMYDCIHTFSFMIPVILSSFFLLIPSFFLLTLYFLFSFFLYSLLTFEKEERNEMPVTLYDGEI